MSTVTVVDHERIGKKGFPMHPEAYPDFALPMKEVPVEDIEGGDIPGAELTPEQQRALMPPISKRQLRLTLVRNGISLSDLDAAIIAMGDEAVIEWQDASEYRRLHPLLNQVAAHLSLTQEQVDAMWQQALTA
ncbi:hypothetical protein [Pseudochrobactrum lubricantis]|uniref:hypothetical protein n=1 Tax=Pseudochrobactrum lubricantis TaxID=558172 RepID=UPI0035E0D771